MTIKVGDRVPAVSLTKMTNHGPEKIDFAAYVADRTIALFSVPGAFTPTCSAKHLPGFVDKAGELKAKGIDEIIGTSVNDIFVLTAWGKAGDVDDKVTLLADGNAEFVKALGLELDGHAFGMGTRGKRFSMVIKDGVIDKLFVEAPGEFKVSAADYLLGQL